MINIILGKAPDQAIANIAKRMNVSKNQAGRLIMTESAYFASAAQKDCFTDLDVEQYEIVATLDSHTSEICQQMDGKHFDMKDYQAGVTAPPFHVWCRSTTAPYFDDEFTVGETRAARDENGKTYQVPADMKYADWKDEFVNRDNKHPFHPITGKRYEDHSILLGSKQLGRKIGKHCMDFGLDPSKAEDRDKIVEIIESIVYNADDRGYGEWRDQEYPVLFHIKGDDVVVESSTEEFVTVLKGGITNARVKNRTRQKV